MHTDCKETGGQDGRASRNAGTSYCSLKGSHHSAEQAECEDALLLVNTEDFAFLGLADGQSGKKYAREGAAQILKAVSLYLEKTGISALRQVKHADEIQYRIIRLIRDTLSELAEKTGAKEEDFSSTLVAFAWNPMTGEYITVHLGDGGIIGRQAGDSLIMLSPPENGLTSRYTWLTTSQEALLHTRIGFGSIGRYERIVLFTDGACALCRGKNISAEARKLLCRNHNRDEILTFIRDSAPTDDASCILLDFYDTPSIDTTVTV